jgi:hypothetical protein
MTLNQLITNGTDSGRNMTAFGAESKQQLKGII